MLAAHWRRHAGARLVAAHCYRLAEDVELTELGVLHEMLHADMLDLFVIEHLVDEIDGAAGNAGFVQQVNPFGAGFANRAFFDPGVDGVAVLGPVGAAGEIRIFGHIGDVQHLA